MASGSTNRPGEEGCPIQGHEDKWEEEHRFNLSQDVFTNMMISFLEVDDDKSHIARVGGQFIGVLVVLMCAFLQLCTAYAVYVHVNNNRHVNLNYINIAFEMFLTNNMTMPIALSQKICGEYEQIESEDGPNSVLMMPDGTRYSADDDTPLFYGVKMPGSSWDFWRLGPDRSIMDEALYVAHNSTPWMVQDGMALVFVLMMTMWFLYIMVEYRSISRFARVTTHFILHPPPYDGSSPIARVDDGHELRYLTKNAKVAGVVIVVLRATVATSLLICGTYFLLYTTATMELIMNSLALVFILEIDNIVFQATASTLRQYLIEDLKAVAYPPVSNSYAYLFPVNKYAKIWCPVLAVTVALVSAFICRWNQITIFQHRFLEAASVCMFMGPTPYGIQGLVAPALGMCDSLLSTTCAPKVEGPGASHGPCVVTDRQAFKDSTVKLYVDGKLFSNMEDTNGTRKPAKKWGRPRQELRAPKGPWDGDLWHNQLRKACINMYQPGGHVDSREVDPDTGEVMNGAPFYCPKIFVFEQVFGRTAGRLKSGEVDNPDVVKSILDPKVQEAMLKCRMGSTIGNEKEDANRAQADAGGDVPGKVYVHRNEAAERNALIHLVEETREESQLQLAVVAKPSLGGQARTRARRNHARLEAAPSAHPGVVARGSSLGRRLRHGRLSSTPPV